VAKQSAGPVLVIVLVVLLVMAVPCAGILVALLLPAINMARESARRAQCQNNLKQIGVSMHRHQMQYKRFPASGEGDPAMSWRVKMLPFLEEAVRFDQYDRTQPWDSPTNRAIIDPMPPTYRCPSTSRSAPDETNYVGVAGENTMMGTSRGVSDAECLDGLSNTILLLEVEGSGITWTEPRDLDEGTFDYSINSDSGAGVESPHPGGINVVLGDGSVRFLREDIDPDVFRAMVSRNGGELLPAEF
jgi:prepilin-type processing-associated H-X9-DG protein